MKSSLCALALSDLLCCVAIMTCLAGPGATGVFAQTTIQSPVDSFYNPEHDTSAQSAAQPSPPKTSPRQPTEPAMYEIGAKFGALGMFSTNSGSMRYSTPGTISGTTALIGVSAGVSLPSSSRWSKGVRLGLVWPPGSVTGPYSQTKLQVAGTLEIFVGAKLRATIQDRPVTVYGAFGGAAGAVQAGSYGQFASPVFSDTESMYGVTASGGAEITVRPNVSLFAEAGYMYLPARQFYALLSYNTYKLTENGVTGAIGFRYHFR